MFASVLSVLYLLLELRAPSADELTEKRMEWLLYLSDREHPGHDRRFVANVQHIQFLFGHSRHAHDSHSSHLWDGRPGKRLDPRLIHICSFSSYEILLLSLLLMPACTCLVLMLIFVSARRFQKAGRLTGW